MSVISGEPSARKLDELTAVVSPEDIREMKVEYPNVHVEQDVLAYMMDIVEKTRNESRFVTGVSTRGALALYHASQVTAACTGRDFVIPEDVISVAPYVLSHRILSKGSESYEDTKKYLDRLIGEVPVPLEDLNK